MGTFVRNGYDPVLQTLGNDFFTMLNNLDSLHDNFLAAFPEMKVPLIRPQRNQDNSLSIHYYSERQGLAPFMMGALKSAASVVYGLDIDIHHRVKRGNGCDHDVFHVFMDSRFEIYRIDLEKLIVINLTVIYSKPLKIKTKSP